METKQAIVLPSGWEAQVENPYREDTALTKRWYEFNKANPPRPLTQYHTPGEKVTVREVLFDTIDKRSCGEYIDNHPLDPERYVKGFEVVSEEESKPRYMCPNCTWQSNVFTECEQCKTGEDMVLIKTTPELSVEEAAEKYFNSLYQSWGAKHAFIAGANWQLNQKGLVRSSDVEKLIRNIIEDRKSAPEQEGVLKYLLTQLKNNK